MLVIPPLEIAGGAGLAQPHPPHPERPMITTFPITIGEAIIIALLLVSIIRR